MNTKTPARPVAVYFPSDVTVTELARVARHLGCRVSVLPGGIHLSKENAAVPPGSHDPEPLAAANYRDGKGRAYEISPRTPELGGGWLLQLFKDGVEVGGGVFPPAEDSLDQELARNAAYDDALNEATAWMES